MPTIRIDVSKVTERQGTYERCPTRFPPQQAVIIEPTEHSDPCDVWYPQLHKTTIDAIADAVIERLKETNGQ